jgi:hypothetical protein
MPNTNVNDHCRALGQQAAMLGWLQIPVEKRRALQQRIAKRQQQHAINQKTGTQS